MRYFDHILQKVRIRLSEWKIKMLSLAGRATLLKVVLQSLPTHLLDSGWVPSNVLDKLKRDFRNFLWSKDGMSRGMTLLS